MSVVVLSLPEQKWYCPNCSATDITKEVKPHTRFHACSALAGMTAPFIPLGVGCKVEAVEREDFIGSDDVQVDGNGRPIMAVVTTRDDGTDRIVFAPTARVRLSDV